MVEYLKGITMKYILITLLLFGCKCEKTSRVKQLGQCSASGAGGITSSNCVALTEDGTKVTRSEPMIVGEEVCTK